MNADELRQYAMWWQRISLAKVTPGLCLVVQELPGAATIGYLKIDAQPIKQALNTIASKWIYSFTHYIQSKVRRLSSS